MRRRPAPSFWAERDAQWQADPTRKINPLQQWSYKKRGLAAWFHLLVRGEDAAKLCAYCDAQLEETSPATIDHFLPRSEFPALAVEWQNLYPACIQCNSTYKRDRWSHDLLRPDVDLLGADAGASDISSFAGLTLNLTLANCGQRRPCYRPSGSGCC